MGEARRRKQLGLYPEKTSKPAPKTRKRPLEYGWEGSPIHLMAALAAASSSYPMMRKR